MKAYQLLSQRGRWTKGYFAKTRHGDLSSVGSHRAYSFCLIGGLRTCYSETMTQKLMKKVEEFLRKNSLRFMSVHEGSIPNWNDAERRRKHEVIAVLKKVERGVTPDGKAIFEL